MEPFQREGARANLFTPDCCRKKTCAASTADCMAISGENWDSLTPIAAGNKALRDLCHHASNQFSPNGKGQFTVNTGARVRGIVKIEKSAIPNQRCQSP